MMSTLSKRSAVFAFSFALSFLGLQFLSLIRSAHAAPSEMTTDGIALGAADKKIIKITDQGFIPPITRFSKLDGSVFFLNATKNSLLTIQIEFGRKKTHCASPNLKVGEDGTVRSINPIGPRDFAITCFPDPGTYKITVQGLSGTAASASGTVVVEG